jgi:hypothetical protein
MTQIQLFDQTTFSDKSQGTHGDCFRATVCTLLQLSPELFPHPIASDGKWNMAFHRKLRDLGFSARVMDYDPALSTDPALVSSENPNWVIPRVVLAAGLSERGVRHSVVWDRIAGRMIHDPHPSRAGLLDIDALDFLMPLSVLAGKPYRHGSDKWGSDFPPSSCTAWEDCVSDGMCHDANCGAPSQHGGGEDV